tara:strand:+ start:205737 stop:207062 length:1326 start_codon:yes stop_codon:yes gene_type:complete
MSKNKISIIISFALILISSLLIERMISSYHYSVNDLNLFKSRKVENQFVFLMGSKEFMNEGNSLARGKIHLNMWNKNQFLDFKEIPRKLIFNLELFEGGEFDLVFNKETILRFSSSKVSIYHLGHSIPQFVKELSTLPLGKQKVVIFNKAIFVNDRQILNLLNIDQLSLKGSLEGKVLISNLEIDDKMIPLSAPLDLSRFGLYFVAISILIILIPFSYLRLNVAIIFLLISIGLFSYDYFYAKEHYVLNYLLSDENKEDSLLIAKERVRVINSLWKDSPDLILFIGSSQTYGEGASTKGKRWSSLYCERIGSKKCLNIAIRSGTTKTFLNLKEEIIESRPAEIFYVLNHNDSNPSLHRRNIKLFAQEMKKQGIKLTFIIEPSLYNLNKDDVFIINTLNVAKELEVKVLDPRLYLKKDSWIWWDVIHLTDLGHQLFSEALWQ